MNFISKPLTINPNLTPKMGLQAASTIRASKQVSRIKRLTLEDVPKATRTLCKAFVNDNLGKLLTKHIKDPSVKAQVDVLLYECYLKQHILKGMCFGVGEDADEFETVAIWSHPNSVNDGLESFSNLMDAGYDKLWHLCGKEGQDKIFRGMMPLLHDTCDRIFATDRSLAGKGVYTLVYMGSLAKARGKGNARAIFEYMFENYIDLPGTNHVSYLESSAASNIPIYNKFGFRFYEDITLGNKDVPNAKEGEDYAVMNVMVRGPFGQNLEPDSKL